MGVLRVRLVCDRHRPSQKAREMDIAEEEEEEEEEPAPSRPAPRSHLSRYFLRAARRSYCSRVHSSVNQRVGSICERASLKHLWSNLCPEVSTDACVKPCSSATARCFQAQALEEEEGDGRRGL